jgi:hypothetical protein
LTVYRQTSGDATHVSLKSLDRHLVSDANGNLVGFQFSPAFGETVDTLSASIAAMLHATEAKLLGLEETAANDSLLALVREWNVLVEASEEPP